LPHGFSLKKMFHLFQTYVAEVLSCCNLSKRRKQTDANADPAGIAVSTCMRISRHEGAPASTRWALAGTTRTTACVGALACRRRFAGAAVACENVQA
jgi:hypothetical protein